MAEFYRRERKHRRSEQIPELLELEKQGYDIRVVNEAGYQFRVNGRLDVYPTNKRWHDLKKNVRGDYDSLSRFIPTFFSQAKPVMKGSVFGTIDEFELLSDGTRVIKKMTIDRVVLNPQTLPQ